MIILHELNNPYTEYKKKKEQEIQDQQAAREAEIAQKFGKRPTVGKYAGKWAKRGAIGLGTVGLVRGAIGAHEWNNGGKEKFNAEYGTNLDNTSYAGNMALAGGSHAALGTAIGAIGGKIKEKLQKRKQRKYDKAVADYKASKGWN